MKRTSRKCVVAALLTILSCGAAAAANGSFSLVLYPRPVSGNGYISEEDDLPGHRVPVRNIQCTVDPVSGVQFVGMEKPDILSFEVYDLSGACVAVFGDEAAFLEYLFARSGEYQIRLITADWAYVGYIGL